MYDGPWHAHPCLTTKWRVLRTIKLTGGLFGRDLVEEGEEVLSDIPGLGPDDLWGGGGYKGRSKSPATHPASRPGDSCEGGGMRTGLELGKGGRFQAEGDALWFQAEGDSLQFLAHHSNQRQRR